VRIVDKLRDKKKVFAAILAVGALGATSAATLGGFSATVASPASTFSTGTLQLEVGHGANNCFSTGIGSGGNVTATNKSTTCAVNSFGGAVNQVPGGTVTTTVVKVTNVGNVAASTGDIVSGVCSASAASDNGGYTGSDLTGFCGKVDLTVQNSATPTACVFPVSSKAACGAPSSAGTLASFAASSWPLSSLAAGASETLTFKIQLDASASNADQGLTATVPLTWSINQ